MEHTILTTYELPFDRDLRIALLSDMHQRDPETAFKLTRDAKPDLICVAGDTFERYDRDHNPLYRTPVSFLMLILSRTLDRLAGYSHVHPPVENAYRFIEELSRIAPVFLSLGNHESYLNDQDRDVLATYHVTLLDNTCVSYQGLTIGGLSTTADDAFLKAFKQVKSPKILMCHHPEYYDRYHLETIDLILAGHTHGGQIRFFDKGFFASGQGLFPKYSRGIYHHHMVISAGLANTVACPRFNNPCEVVIINLKKPG